MGVETVALTPKVWAISFWALGVQTILEISEGTGPAGSGLVEPVVVAAGDAPDEQPVRARASPAMSTPTPRGGRRRRACGGRWISEEALIA